MLEVNDTLINRAIDLNKISHAYLFETDYSEDNMNYIYDFIVKIFSKNKNKEDIDIIRKRIMDKNYTEFKIIKKDGQFIKKEQILSLKEDFSSKSQENDLRVYMIYESDKLNASSGNTLLKFLEEPDDNIVGILLTNNIHSVLETLVSRCQIISLQKNKNITMSENYLLILQFLYDIEKNKINIYNNLNDYDELFKDKDSIVETLKNMTIILYDIVNYKINGKYKYIKENEYIKYIENNNDLNNLSEKIGIIDDLLNKSNYNINQQLLLDRLIILMSGGRYSGSTG